MCLRGPENTTVSNCREIRVKFNHGNVFYFATQMLGLLLCVWQHHRSDPRRDRPFDSCSASFVTSYDVLGQHWTDSSRKLVGPLGFSTRSWLCYRMQHLGNPWRILARTISSLSLRHCNYSSSMKMLFIVSSQHLVQCVFFFSWYVIC